jgi:protein phosphatase
LAVRVQCPHCGTVCQIQENHLGGNVTCGKCAKVFATRRPDSASAPPAETGAVTAAALPPKTPEGNKSLRQSALGGLWSGVQNFYQKIAKSGASAAPHQERAPVIGEAQTSADDEDLSLVLDGPAAATLRQEDAEKPQPPRLGADPPHVHGRFRLDLGGATSVGRVRDRNEDSYLVQYQSWCNLDARHEAALIVLADGMGGHHAGDLASLLAIQHIASALRDVWANFAPGAEEGKTTPWRDALEGAIRSANAAVHQQGQRDAAGKGMGATAAVVLVCDDRVEIGHVGDCRVYHFHEASLTQVTRDQTLVARMVELGQLSEQEAKDHPRGNEVTQALGKGADIQPAFCQLRLVPGDWLIVACDGLHAHVDARKLAEVLQAAPSAAALVAHHLVDLANFHGGTDNCTVVALRCY